MKLSRRPAIIKDIPFLRELNRRTMYDVVVETYGSWDESQFDKSDPIHRTEMICLGKSPIGMLRSFEEGGSIIIQDIQILPECQGKGLGTKIILEVLRDAEKKGLRVTLQVFKKNQARMLYEKVGFLPTGETENHILMVWSTGGRLC